MDWLCKTPYLEPAFFFCETEALLGYGYAFIGLGGALKAVVFFLKGELLLICASFKS
jgi:hypothetical protein